MGNMYSIVMLASGSGESHQIGFPKQLRRLPNDLSPDFTTNNPLSGVHLDILRIKEIYSQRRKNFSKSMIEKQIQVQAEPQSGSQDNFNQQLYLQQIIVESFSVKGKFPKRKQITSKLAQAFLTGRNTFIYTGHGMYEGAMVINTQENKEGQPFTIEELVQIFLENRLKNKVLLIFLDCSFSGKMAIHLKQMQIPSDVLIFVYCSSGPSDLAIDLNNYGGLLVCWFWAQQTESKFLLKENIYNLEQIFQLKNPFKLYKEDLQERQQGLKKENKVSTSKTSSWKKQTNQKGWADIKPLKWNSTRIQQQGQLM